MHIAPNAKCQRVLVLTLWLVICYLFVHKDFLCLWYVGNETVQYCHLSMKVEVSGRFSLVGLSASSSPQCCDTGGWMTGRTYASLEKKFLAVILKGSLSEQIQEENQLS